MQGLQFQLLLRMEGFHVSVIQDCTHVWCTQVGCEGLMHFVTYEDFVTFSDHRNFNAVLGETFKVQYFVFARRCLCLWHLQILIKQVMWSTAITSESIATIFKWLYVQGSNSSRWHQPSNAVSLLLSSLNCGKKPGWGWSLSTIYSKSKSEWSCISTPPVHLHVVRQMCVYVHAHAWDQDMKVTTDAHLMPRLRVSVAEPLVLHVLLWRVHRQLQNNCLYVVFSYCV